MLSGGVSFLRTTISSSTILLQSWQIIVFCFLFDVVLVVHLFVTNEYNYLS